MPRRSSRCSGASLGQSGTKGSILPTGPGSYGAPASVVAKLCRPRGVVVCSRGPEGPPSCSVQAFSMSRSNRAGPQRRVIPMSIMWKLARRTPVVL